MGVSTAKILNGYLKDNKIVEIETPDGEKFTFRILRVSMASWDPENKWYSKLMATSPKAMQVKMVDEIGAPSQAVIRQIILDGVSEPEIVSDRPKADDSSIWINDLLRSDLLCRKLYQAITNYSWKGIAEVNLKEDHAKPRPNS